MTRHRARFWWGVFFRALNSVYQASIWDLFSYYWNRAPHWILCTRLQYGIFFKCNVRLIFLFFWGGDSRFGKYSSRKAQIWSCRPEWKKIARDRWGVPNGNFQDRALPPALLWSHHPRFWAHSKGLFLPPGQTLTRVYMYIHTYM